MKKTQAAKFNKLRKGASVLLCVLIFALLLSFASDLLTPKRYDYGSCWGEFLAEPKNSVDVMFFGTSRVYCNVAPAAIYSESGVKSYVLAGASQTISITYHYIKEALKTQSPSTIFVEVSSLAYSKYEDYTKINIGYMPFGINKIQTILECSENENKLGLFFPLSFYHSRWDKLCADDWKVAWSGYNVDMLAGYTYIDEYYATKDGIYWDYVPDASAFEENLVYVQKIQEFCDEKGINCIFFIAPSHGLYQQNYDEKIIAAVSQIGQLVDCREFMDEMGIDKTVDYQGTIHLNIVGANKFSIYLANFIEKEGLAGPNKNPDALWDGRVEYYNDLLEKPLKPRTFD